jgi:hypothetical protein
MDPVFLCKTIDKIIPVLKYSLNQVRGHTCI